MDNPTHNTPFSLPDPDPLPRIYEAEVVATPPRYAYEPVRYFRRRFWVPLICFLLTWASTLFAGWFWCSNPRLGWSGWMFAVPLMTILMCHEAGHFIQARRHGVYASFPYFIPMPISPFGTMGAVIAMEARIGHRRALFDIGITGPLAGLVPTLIFSYLGLKWSVMVPVSAVGAGMSLGEPLLFKLLSGWLLGAPPDGFDVYLHPVAFAGWVGLFLTAMNLIPVGQFDGGHVLYAILRRKAHTVAKLILVGGLLSVGVAYYVFHYTEAMSWLVLLFLMWLLGYRHPPTADDDEPLGTWRYVLGWLTLAIIPLGFTPIPIAESQPEPRRAVADKEGDGSRSFLTGTGNSLASCPQGRHGNGRGEERESDRGCAAGDSERSEAMRKAGRRQRSNAVRHAICAAAAPRIRGIAPWHATRIIRGHGWQEA